MLSTIVGLTLTGIVIEELLLEPSDRPGGEWEDRRLVRALEQAASVKRHAKRSRAQARRAIHGRCDLVEARWIIQAAIEDALALPDWRARRRALSRFDSYFRRTRRASGDRVRWGGGNATQRRQWRRCRNRIEPDPDDVPW